MGQSEALPLASHVTWFSEKDLLNNVISLLMVGYLVLLPNAGGPVFGINQDGSVCVCYE